MKKKILLTILMIALFMILVSCNACTSSSAHSPEYPKYEYVQDTIKADSTKRDSIVVLYTASTTPDSIKHEKIMIKRKLMPMKADTTIKLDANAQYEKLEKTQMEIKEQQKVLDSMLVVRKKK